jgi:hypothetical protein
VEFRIKKIDDLQMIEIIVEGLLTQEIRKNILIDSTAFLAQTGYKRLLIDVVNSVFSPGEPMTGALTLINYMKQLGFPTGTRIAFLYRDAETHRKFFESMAQMEGFSLKYFQERDAAIDWLCER